VEHLVADCRVKNRQAVGQVVALETGAGKGIPQAMSTVRTEGDSDRGEQRADGDPASGESGHNDKRRAKECGKNNFGVY
jgi:hypothetical protein